MSVRRNRKEEGGAVRGGCGRAVASRSVGIRSNEQFVHYCKDKPTAALKVFLLQGLTIKFEQYFRGSTSHKVNARETCDIYIYKDGDDMQDYISKRMLL